MNNLDFFKKFQPLFEAKQSVTEADYPSNGPYDNERGGGGPGTDIMAIAAKKKAKVKKEAEKKKAEAKKPANVKETAQDFFRKYSDMIAEAEESDIDESKGRLTGKTKVSKLYRISDSPKVVKNRARIEQAMTKDGTLNKTAVDRAIELMTRDDYPCDKAIIMARAQLGLDK